MHYSDFFLRIFQILDNILTYKYNSNTHYFQTQFFNRISDNFLKFKITKKKT
jgi:hypothetical protein